LHKARSRLGLGGKFIVNREPGEVKGASMAGLLGQVNTSC